MRRTSVFVLLLLTAAAFHKKPPVVFEKRSRTRPGRPSLTPAWRSAARRWCGRSRSPQNTLGDYLFPALPPGEYTVTVTASGFRSVKQTGINLQVGRLLTVDIRLKMGAVTESVTITAAAALVDVPQSASQANVSRSFFEWLPKGALSIA